MLTFDAYEAPHVWVWLTCEGPDYHDNPPHTYRVEVNRSSSGRFDPKAWETACETRDYGEARARFLVEARRAYKAGEIDRDWLEEEEGLQEWKAMEDGE